MICPECKTQNPGHARFCGKCGHEIAPTPPPPPRNPPAPDKTTDFFKWVGYIFTGLIVLGMLSNCNF